jgi:hypothetical protein
MEWIGGRREKRAISIDESVEETINNDSISDDDGDDDAIDAAEAVYYWA